ncbi:MAG: DUF4258 domain-containing protein [Chloracidobacterium sp.]|nr:DUF4258 domain-containing protein [Chloracidobacterium sp.]
MNDPPFLFLDTLLPLTFGGLKETNIMHIENISNHAKLRQAQRNLSEEDIAFVLRYGQEIHRTGASFFFLGVRDLPDRDARSMSRLVGSIVVVNWRGIVTVYRNSRGLRRIKRKMKYHITRQFD